MTAKSISEQIGVIREAIENAMTSREAALEFLRSAGIVRGNGKAGAGVKYAEAKVVAHSAAWTVRNGKFDAKRKGEMAAKGVKKSK